MKSHTLLLALLTLGFSAAKADTIAYTHPAVDERTAGTGVVGMNFSVTTAIDVTQLGFYGDAMGGGDTPWVALFDASNMSTPLASITTYASTNGWQYIALGAPVTLTVGNTYRIVAPAYWSPRYPDASGFTFGPEISSVSFSAPTGWGGWGTPSFGSVATATMPNVTGNFQYTVSAIPEPSTYAALAGLGVLGMAVVRRRRS